MYAYTAVLIFVRFVAKVTPQRQAAGTANVSGVTGHVLHSAMLAGSDAHRQASGGGPAVLSGELVPRYHVTTSLLSPLMFQATDSKKKNAVRRSLRLYTVLSCVSHFNSVIAKRIVAEKMLF